VISDWKEQPQPTISVLRYPAQAVYTAARTHFMIDSHRLRHLCHVLQVAVAVAYCGRPVGR
jgi:hypothetical protein